MSRLDRLLGLDDERTLPQRAPLWKRAVWRAMKSLARHHPRALLKATLSGFGYAGKQATVEVVESAAKRVAPGKNNTGPCETASGYRLDEKQRKELLDAVAAEDLRQLAQLGRNDPKETKA
jgi:hypothetical protein